MIPLQFDYYRPDTIQEAAVLYQDLAAQDKSPLYYGGGSEIISMARAHNIQTGAVIDLKGIPQCTELSLKQDQLVIGGAVTLAQISESGLFPLLGKTGGRIADHTMQCKITLGGNLAGTIFYREAALPLLLADAQAVISSQGRLKQVPLESIFQERLQLDQGDFLVQFLLQPEFATFPFVHVKKTKNEKIDYPLLTLAALKKDRRIRVALSGICPFPFRSPAVESFLNETGLPAETRVMKALDSLPAPILNDLSGSDSYRRFVLKTALLNTLETLEATEHAEN